MVPNLPYTIEFPFREKLYPIPLLKAIIVSGSILAIIGSFNGYALKIITAFAVLYFITRWLFTKSFTVAIYFALVYQWFQVSIKVLYGLFTGVQFESLSRYPDNLSTAFYYSAFSLLLLSSGIHYQLKRISYSEEDFEESLNTVSTSKIMIAYIAFSVLINVLYSLRFVIPGLFQAITLLNNFKWVLLYIFYFSAYKNNKNILSFWIIVLIEFLMSFVSFFADFKSYIFYILILNLSYGYFNKKKLRTLLFYGAGAFLLAFIWTGIKSDYRQFLNKGSASQAILVEHSAASEYLINAVSNFDIERNKDKTLESLIDRISYIDYFSACISYIPSHKPHENGKVLKQSILHILMPRILFPNKQAIDDSDHLNKYTGLSFANAKKGVSFSLGYIGDFYIDFGFIFMLFAIFIFGNFIGLILLSIYNAAPSPFWGAALLTGSFYVLYKLEISQIKFIGNLIWFWIVFYFLSKFIVPRFKHLIEK